MEQPPTRQRSLVVKPLAVKLVDNDMSTACCHTAPTSSSTFDTVSAFVFI
jgi:hypothetical protein